MLRKIWNTMRHGDGRTKRYLFSVFGLFVVALLLLAAAIVTQSALPWIGVIAVALITAAMAKDAKLAVIKDNAKREGMSETELAAELEQVKAEKLRKKAERRAKKSKEKNEKKEKKANEEDGYEEFFEEEEEENSLETMTEEKLKKLFIRYKVKQEHVPVVIDLCISERIRQAPGFAWVDDGMLKILLIEHRARMIERPLSRLQVMEVERGVAVKASSEYTELRDSDMMKKVFTPYLPRYQKKEIGGRTVLLKNLYILDEEIKFTSTSVNELRKLFAFRIEIADRRLQEGAMSPYYKEVYVNTFLWKDGILSLKEYKEEIEQTITNLASKEVPYGEFETTLTALITSGLIPAEYRAFANAKREESERGTEEKTEKRKSGKKVHSARRK